MLCRLMGPPHGSQSLHLTIQEQKLGTRAFAYTVSYSRRWLGPIQEDLKKFGVLKTMAHLPKLKW